MLAYTLELIDDEGKTLLVSTGNIFYTGESTLIIPEGLPGARKLHLKWNPYAPDEAFDKLDKEAVKSEPQSPQT